MEELVRALQRIPPTQREALVLRELEGRSYDEIAETLNLTKSALETLLFRARRSLADELENAATCDRAELSLSRQLDGRISRKERRRLLDHIAECPACARLQVTQGKQRRAFKGLALLPLPFALTFFKGAPSASAATGLPTIGTAARRERRPSSAAVLQRAAVFRSAVSPSEAWRSRRPPSSRPSRSRAASASSAHARSIRAVALPRRSLPRGARALGATTLGGPPDRARRPRRSRPLGSNESESPRPVRTTGKPRPGHAAKHNGAAQSASAPGAREGAADTAKVEKVAKPTPSHPTHPATPAPGSSTHASQARRHAPRPRSR